MEEPVARWEIWSVATMLLATHGDEAEGKADRAIAAAMELQDMGALSVWRAIRFKLDELRAQQADRSGKHTLN